MITLRVATGAAFGCLFASLVVCAQESVKNGIAKENAPDYLQEFRLLKDQADERLRLLYEMFEKDFDRATTEDERERLMKALREQSFAVPEVRKALELVLPHAGDGAAIEPLLWIASQGRATDHGQKGAALLIKHHLTSPKTVEFAFRLRQSNVAWVTQMLRAQVATRDLPEDQRPRQILALAQTLHASVESKQGDVGKLTDETIQLFTELGKKYAEKEYRGGVTFGELAKSSLFEIKSLSIGKIAPDIEGEDLDGVSFKLSDYRGKVVIVSFWARWCEPCIAKLPHERELVEKYGGRPFVLIGVNADPDAAVVSIPANAGTHLGSRAGSLTGIRAAFSDQASFVTGVTGDPPGCLGGGDNLGKQKAAFLP